MAKTSSGPFEFAGVEADKLGATVGIVAWEMGGEIKYRTIPEQSRMVLIGVHEELGRILDRLNERKVEGDDDD